MHKQIHILCDTAKKTKLNVCQYDGGKHFNEMKTYKTLKVSAACMQCMPKIQKIKTREKEKYLIRDEIKRFIRLIIRLTKITGKDSFKIHTNIIMWLTVF